MKPVVHEVRCTYPQCQATNGCVGACSKTEPVHASDMSEKHVHESDKDLHEHEDDIYDIWVEQGTCQENRQVAKNATTERGQVGTESGPSQDQVGTRIWVGLTDEDRQELAAEGLCFAVEAKLKEKNMNDYNKSIHSNPDAQAWAKFFIDTIAEQSWRVEDIDEGLMTGWFANAMMAMHDHVKREWVWLTDTEIDDIMRPLTQNQPFSWRAFGHAIARRLKEKNA